MDGTMEQISATFSRISGERYRRQGGGGERQGEHSGVRWKDLEVGLEGGFSQGS